MSSDKVNKKEVNTHAENTNSTSMLESSQDLENNIATKQVTSLPKLTTNKAGQKLTVLLIDQIKKLIDINNELRSKIKSVEDQINELNAKLEKNQQENEDYKQKISALEESMNKFMGLYELVTSQFNPFVDSGSADSSKEMPDVKTSTVFKEIKLDDIQEAKEKVKLEKFNAGVARIQKLTGSPNPKLVEYVAIQTKKGRSRDYIVGKLREAGWSMEEIKRAYNSLF